MGRLIDHIKANLYYYELTYNKSPEKIFISTPLITELWSELTLVNLHRDGFYTTCCGILVEEFRSNKLEYYLLKVGSRLNYEWSN